MKYFASQTLPQLELHLDNASSVAGKVGATTNASFKSKSPKTSASMSQPQ